MLVLCIVVGLSVEDLSEAGGPFLGIDELTFHRAVHPGDTLTARSTVVEARESQSRPASGIVTWHTEGLNQRDELVVDYRRTNLVARARPSTVTREHVSWYLTEQRRALQDTARRFAMDEVLPLANELDPQKARHPALVPRPHGRDGLLRDHPADRRRRHGARRVRVLPDHRGAGAGLDERRPRSSPAPTAWAPRSATRRRRRDLLERSARGEWIGAAALSEPDAGSDLANVQCRATQTATST